MGVHRTSIHTLTAALALLLAPGALLRGQTISSPYTFVETGQEGGVFFGIVSPGTGTFGVGPDAGPVLGVRYGVELGGPFALEGVLRTLASDRDVIDPRRLEGDRKIGEADVLLTSLDVRVKFSLPGRRNWHGLAPHAILGGGLAIDLEGTQEIDRRLEERDRFDFGTSFVGLMGAGVRWMPSDHFVVRTDGVLNLWQISNPDGFRDPDRDFRQSPGSEWVNGLSVTLGVALRW